MLTPTSTPPPAPLPSIDDLKRQIAQLDALIAEGVLTGDTARRRRDALEQAIVDAISTPADALAAPMHPMQQPQPMVQPAPRRLLAAVVAFALVFGAAGYAWRGNRDGLHAGPGRAAPTAGAAAAAGGDGGGGAQSQAAIDAEVEAMVARLAERLKTKPDDADGMAMLARSYTALRRFPEAVDVYKRLLPLRPRDAQVLVDYADALAMVNNRTLDGEPERLVLQAVQLDPRNLKALSLAGTVAFNRADYGGAVGYWQKAVDLSEPDGELTRQLQSAMAEARQRGGLPAVADATAPQLPAVMPQAAVPTVPRTAGTPSPAVVAAQPSGGQNAAAAAAATTPSAPTAPGAATAAASISGRITLAAALKARVAAGDTLFVFARPTGGARMPLAILRKQAGDLPLDFTLDDSLAMSPATRLSQASQVIVGARVSKSGNPIAQPGDLQGLSAPVAVGTRGLQVEISELLP